MIKVTFIACSSHCNNDSKVSPEKRDAPKHKVVLQGWMNSLEGFLTILILLTSKGNKVSLQSDTCIPAFVVTMLSLGLQTNSTGCSLMQQRRNLMHQEA